jgi:hypothetical protein
LTGGISEVVRSPLEIRSCFGSDAGETTAVFREVIAEVREIYGADDACHPVFPPNLAFSLNGRHLPFIDGADGGLFLAAKALKQRVAEIG